MKYLHVSGRQECVWISNKVLKCTSLADKAKPKPVHHFLGAPCDVQTPCEEDSIPMHVESGDFHAGRKTLPRVCIDGKL